MRHLDVIARSVQTAALCAGFSLLAGACGVEPEPQKDSAPPADPCGEGLVQDSDGGCVPEACGQGRWGAIEGATVFVDASAETGGDGSQQAPFTSIQQGLDAAAAAGGGTVAVAAGSYPELISLGTGHDHVRLAGRCREMVTIDASEAAGQVPGIDLRASGSEISGLTLWRPPWMGVRIQSGTATLRQVDVIEPGYVGVVAYYEGLFSLGLTLEDCVLDRSGTIGLAAYGRGAEVTAIDSVIQDTQPDPTGSFGIGVQVYGEASVSLVDSEITKNRWTGVLAMDHGSTVSLAGGTVKDTTPGEGGVMGWGVAIHNGATATIDGVEIAGNTGVGLNAYGAETLVRVEASAIRDTGPHEDGSVGCGVGVSLGASVELEASEIAANSNIGVFAYDSGSSVRMSDTIVRDTLPNSGDQNGLGMLISDAASAVIVGGELRDNLGAGVSILGDGSSLSASGTIIAGTRDAGGSGRGYGVFLEAGGSASLSDCELTDNTLAGVGAYGEGTTLSLDGCIIRDTRALVDDSMGYGIEATGGARVTAVGCSLSGNSNAGVASFHGGTTVELSESTVHDTLCGLEGVNGFGVAAMEGSSLRISGGELALNRGAGAYAHGSELILQDTVVRDTRIQDAGPEGKGVWVEEGSTLLAEGCEIHDNIHAGVLISGQGTRATLVDTVIRDTRFEPTNPLGEFAFGLATVWGAQVLVEGCELRGNGYVSVLSQGEGSTVTLIDCRVSDTQPIMEDSFGAGLLVLDGGQLSAEDSVLSGHVTTGVAVSGQGSRVELVGGAVQETRPGGDYTIGIGITAQDRGVVSATGLTLRGNEGPGVYLSSGGVSFSCTDCAIEDNAFAGVVSRHDSSVRLEACTLQGTRVQENLGGGFGVYAETIHPGYESSLELLGNTIEDNPIAGVWLSGDGSYQLVDNLVRGGEGWSRGGVTKCGDAVYARMDTGPWDGRTGLLMQGNTLSSSIQAGLFLNGASATLEGNAWSGNQTDLIRQGEHCEAAPEGFDSESLTSWELCPARYEYGTCDDAFNVLLELAEIESRQPVSRALPPGAPVLLHSSRRPR